MTPSEVAARVERIRSLADDAEAAHCEEDGLYRDVLRAIADGTCTEPRWCARTALDAGLIDFPRWCA